LSNHFELLANLVAIAQTPRSPWSLWFVGHVTDMSKPTAVTRHQQVTTTANRGNELEKSQEIFEEMTKLLAKK
jgi:hypothetical protein